MKEPKRTSASRDAAADGDRIFEVRSGIAALRGLRSSLMEIAYATAKRPRAEAFLVLSDVAISRERLRSEWALAGTVLQPSVLNRLSLCIAEGDGFVGIPRDPDAETQRALARVVDQDRLLHHPKPTRGDAAFVVLKLLLHRWLTSDEPFTTDWLAQTCGYSYPTVASVLRGMGSLIERGSDRRIRVRWFPREEINRLEVMSERARGSVRFADSSGRPRAVESHVRRLEKLDPPGIAIGGVLGAQHYDARLDLSGPPRLDLSQHSPKRVLDLKFIEALDPALKRVDDPLQPATVVVHAVRHADPLFTARQGGLRWGDPVECMLDLFDARLERQASEFLETLKRTQPDGHATRGR